MAVAELLGKFPHEILALTPDEFALCVAYLIWKNRKEKEAMDKARQEAKTQSGPRRKPRRGGRLGKS